MGLSIPYNFYQGAFKSAAALEGVPKSSNQHLITYLNHLQSITDSGEILGALDLEAFRNDIQNGLYFDSSIPQGFGVGSSGALVAAIYDRYAVNKIASEGNMKPEDFIKLKKIFSQMESYFH
jgi:mevalonate kinase